MSLIPMQEISHPRQRASAACVFCHSRKVRCDALTTYPCTRCKESNLQCTLRTSNRGKTRRSEPKVGRAGRAAGSYPPQPRAEPTINPATNSPPASSDDLLRSLENFIENSNGPVDDKYSAAIIHATNNNAFTTILNAATGTEQNTHRNVHLYVGVSTHQSTMDRYRDAIGKLDQETRSFLASKGVFDWPEKHLADHLIDKYFQYADPHNPILHKRDFLRRYAEKDVPPLLLHSVMFAACHFADQEQIDVSPWLTQKSMASQFFEKAKLVADFELEKDQITLVQSYVILSDRWVSWTDERNSRYWMSRAINVAYMMGLHRKIETLNLTPSQQRLWNRIAWVVAGRDSVVSATFGTPVIIDNRWTDKSYTELDTALYEESEPGETNYVSLRSPATIEYCIQTTINSAVMSWTLSKIHAISRNPRFKAEPVNLEEISDLVRKSAATCPSLLDIELQDASSIPKAELVFKPMVRICHATVMIFHHWALISIHADPILRKESREKTRFHAIQLCETMGYLREHELFPLCPFWLTTGVFHAMAVLLDDCRNALLFSSESRDSKSIGYLRELNEDLGIIEKTWKPAGWFREIMRAALARLRDNVRKRKRKLDQLSSHETEQQPEDDTPQTLYGEYGMDEPFVNLYESTRVHFPDFENLFTWDLNDGSLPTL
ncbi:hypothetical protein BS50DRAFT_671698 [Corynespora cassiicola Philippines]|uniref:Zn(2)-C6 fungal-type domain-containing protein n=1 Tax=Corynespora cassiicola Philippines TaxID=1448308 RepID=A0A2T2PD73_CORCC|nr:hypothetical protein BS50DRAFT_671698 [Corynespora cassiicola Philippines]